VAKRRELFTHAEIAESNHMDVHVIRDHLSCVRQLELF
jgi:hypothetical protein